MAKFINFSILVYFLVLSLSNNQPLLFRRPRVAERSEASLALANNAVMFMAATTITNFVSLCVALFVPLAVLHRKNIAVWNVVFVNSFFPQTR